MSQSTSDWVFVRDSQRQMCWHGCNDWDQITLVAALSSDPRTWEELCLAWSRYRSNQALPEFDWHASPSPEPGSDWLYIDLEARCFAWDNPDELDSREGVLSRDEGPLSVANPLVCLNVPPWWRELSREGLAERISKPAELYMAAEADIDFRTVLYGRPLVEQISDRMFVRTRPLEVTAPQATGAGKHTRADEHASGNHTDTENLPVRPVARLGETDPSRNEREQSTSPEAVAHDCVEGEFENDYDLFVDDGSEAMVKSIHVEWLLTPRVDLEGMTPRDMCHRYRTWKENELDHRRSQWSRQKCAPVTVPRTSAQFRYGPMGIEEVVTYFDMCRELVWHARRLVEDELHLSQAELADHLEVFRDEWLAHEDEMNDGMTAREVIDQERSLLPRVAAYNPVDCDCPLCRIGQFDTSSLGPAFMICDGFHLEMENEFAFSLSSDRDEWEMSRELWSQRSDPPRHSGQCDNESQPPKDDRRLRPRREADSYIEMAQSSPQLSLLCIGFGLAEILQVLKDVPACQEQINVLNRAFDQLGRAMGDWLVADPHDAEHILRQRADIATAHMIRVLQEVAVQHKQLSARSAELQEVVQLWQSGVTAPQP